LNPNLPDFIARKIGDRHYTWSDSQRRWRDLGTYENRSKFVRVELNSDVEVGGTNPAFLPFGFEGPDRLLTLGPGKTHLACNVPDDAGGAASVVPTAHAHPIPANAFVAGGSGSIPAEFSPSNRSGAGLGTPAATGSYIVSHGTIALHGYPKLPVEFPSLKDFLRLSASQGNLGNKKDAYFGVNSQQDSGSSVNFDESYLDLVRPLPPNTAAAEKEISFRFSLDDVVVKTTANDNDARVWHQSGSRRQGDSHTATDGYKSLLDLQYDRFTMPLVGGFDGTDITEKDPFNMRSDVLGASETVSSVHNSWRRALNSVADPEVVEFNALVAPGLTKTALTDHMIDICEDRRDALAIIDLEGGYVPRAQTTDDDATRKGDVDTVVSNMKARGVNSSYACSYYPWVQVLDSFNSGIVWVPPSVVALGTFASSERSSAIWFAPAGFVRGGLSEGAAGLTVVNVDGKLTSRDRDRLYTESVNPIASFPAEGIVIFGQKTMQVKSSALDRINVRRLLLFIKKGVSRIAATTLFENNIPATWNGFSGRTEKFLESIKSGGGLTDFKVVLDDTTTTADLIDRNVLYAKVFLKPARAIEFIAVDFIITRTGASFED
jgi:phage tail sheath protein FI